MTYEAATGYNNTAGYVELDPPPRLEVIEDGRIEIAGDGLSYADGFKQGELIWGYLTTTQFTALLTIFGLTSAKSARITISLPIDNNRDHDDCNAIIEKPNPRFERGRFIDVRFPLRRIVEI